MSVTSVNNHTNKKYISFLNLGFYCIVKILICYFKTFDKYAVSVIIIYAWPGSSSKYSLKLMLKKKKFEKTQKGHCCDKNP